MADYMSQAEISSLKDALCAQQNLLQKLYHELDAEREASATAASEALNVILRLQGEKAAVKMEAEQYKRLAEEKMCHAEESFAIIEDIICQKEMEVAALDYQVQAYRYKLLSMGCVDPGGGELKFPENLLQRNEQNLSPETGFHNLSRRNSAPIPAKFKKGLIEIEHLPIPETDLISKVAEEQQGVEINYPADDPEKKTDNPTSGGINSYSEQIKKLDERVKEIAGANYVISSKNEARSSTSLSTRPSGENLQNLIRLPSTLSSRPSATNLPNLTRSSSQKLSNGNTYDPNKEAAVNETVDYPCSASVHDVFEVPQADENLAASCEPLTKDKKSKMPCREIGSPESEDLVHPEAVKICAKEVPDWLKKLLQSTHREKNLYKRPSDVDCSIVQPSTSSVSEAQPSMNRLNRTAEIVEAERLAKNTNREEELKLLKEIKEQINLLHKEIRSQEVKKSSLKDEPPSCLPEAMLYFWL